MNNNGLDPLNDDLRHEPALQDLSKGDKKQPGVLQFILETLETLILAVILYFLIDSVVARVRVENISMLPTLQAGEFLLVNKMSYRFGDVQHGDIVVFHYPADPQEDYIKRVIGLPGDEVIIEGDQVYVNGQQLIEDYISAEPHYDGKWNVPQDNLFVLGDNRNQSSDSHSWGYVPMANVVGKAIVIYWPPSQIRTLKEPFVVNASSGNGDLSQ